MSVNTGEVVCDSILLNKQKTKTYWEQMMMAATTSELPKAQYHHVGPSPSKRDLLGVSIDSEHLGGASDTKPSLHSDVSEQDFFDARSQISLNSPVNQLEHYDEPDTNPGPKIVETVAKKLVEVDNIKLVSSGDKSVIARDIRIQQEKEETLLRDREKALQWSVGTGTGTMPTPTPMPTPAEAKIAMELREMREREEELRALRQSLTHAKEEDDALVANVVIGEDTFNSIPNTDEGNYSEYGSEEKELSLDGNNSRMMSPEVPNQTSFLHQRTQSMDSMSSGHSSGSGSGATESYNNHNNHNNHNINNNNTNNKRRVTVKPYEEPEEEEVPTYMRGEDSNIAEEPLIKVTELEKTDPVIRNLKETPIEREIRLAHEREEELRREKRLLPFASPSPVVNVKEIRRTHRDAITNDPRSVQHRLATNRIQQEINEATEREKELRSAGTIQTTSEETVDSKVTRFTDLAEYSIEEQDRKLQKAVSTSHIPSGDLSTPTAPKPLSSLALNGSPRHATLNRSISTNILSPSHSVSPQSGSPSRRFGPSMGQKGIMERFLLSRGKLMGMSTFGSTGSSGPNVNAIRPISPVLRHDYSPTSLPSIPAPAVVVVVPAPPAPPKVALDMTPIDERQLSIESDEKDRERGTPLRKGYTSAEDKIQAELQEMRRREEELRLQRARTFARSQPNLMTIIDDDNADEEPAMLNDFDSPMSIGGLRAALSNPNLLDSEETEISDKFQPSNKNARKRNALIMQWENRIQQYTVEH